MDAILRTRFDWPQLGSDIVVRPRLRQALTEARAKRLIVVTGPAGYGKSTLLADWLQNSSLARSWLSLDMSDSDLATFLSYFITAIQLADPKSCKRSQAMLQAPRLPAMSELATTLINDLAELSKELFLVLDDYQVIKERSVHELVAALVSRCPHHFHLIIASRSNPPLPIPQWRARGQVAELRAADLCFTHDEAREFLGREAGMKMTAGMVDDILEFSEGWITGLKLTAISIRGRATHARQSDKADIARSVIREAAANRHVADFLFEDVFSRQPHAIREFLMRTSILEQFTAPLCDALGNPGAVDGAAPETQARVMLKWIARANLFLIPLDESEGWYRYHHLFRELLMHRLKQNYDDVAIRRLHTQASDWLAGEEMIERALQHALAAGQLERAADLVEQNRHVPLNVDNWRVLERWLNLLPRDLEQKRPALLLARAWVLHFQSRISATVPISQAASAQLDTWDASDARTQSMRGELEVLRSHVIFYQNQYDESVKCAEAALKLISHAHAYARGVAAVVFGVSARAVGKANEAARMLELLIDQDPDKASPVVLRARMTQSWIACMDGEWDKARVLANNGLELATQAGNENLVYWFQIYLGTHFYQQNDLDRAIEHFGAGSRSIQGQGGASATSSLIGLSMSYLARGNSRMAIETADTLSKFALEVMAPGLVFESQAFRAHMSLLQNDVAPALHWANTANFQNNLGELNFLEAPLITRVWAFVADGTPASLSTANALLQSVLSFARATHNVWREVELLAIKALLLRAQGETEASLDALEQSLVLARPGHFVRTFLDLGSALAKPLSELVRQGRQADYARELLDSFTQLECAFDPPVQKTSDQMIEPLTSRELEILKLMDQHLSNTEIAHALFISPLTVKSHTRNLFGKLGVNRRRFAIKLAHETGLLPAS